MKQGTGVEFVRGQLAAAARKMNDAKEPVLRRSAQPAESTFRIAQGVRQCFGKQSGRGSNLHIARALERDDREGGAAKTSPPEP